MDVDAGFAVCTDDPLFCLQQVNRLLNSRPPPRAPKMNETALDMSHKKIIT